MIIDQPDILNEVRAWETDFHARNGRIPGHMDREQYFVERITALQKQLTGKLEELAMKKAGTFGRSM